MRDALAMTLAVGVASAPVAALSAFLLALLVIFLAAAVGGLVLSTVAGVGAGAALLRLNGPSRRSLG